MDFSLTDEQSMLADSVERFIDNDYDFDTRQRIAASEDGYSREVWESFAELGWTAMLFSESDGGLDGGPVEMMVMMEQFGRGLVVEPFLATVVLAGGLLKRAASPAQKERWLPALIGGEMQAALAFSEPQSRFRLSDVATTARADGTGYVLDGCKSVVPNGGGADLLIVPARTSGEQTERDGITLFALSGQSEAVIRTPYPTVDGHRAAEIRLQGVRVEADAVLGRVGGGLEPLEATIEDATLAVCAEAYGILRSMQAKTVEYSKNRIQFGVPIGSFQALQHRMVDMLMACEQIRSLLLRATIAAASGSVSAQQAISALKYHVGTAGRLVAQEAVQLHGGMGVTWELDIAHYFKRFTAIELLFGNADFHLDRFVQSSARRT
ncbi:MAG TPA: acyl-CoA dehydrogenase family protein [Woeseiaceae bacterium]|nr:acyl-CoA dehydrogenase family protein [Woeseiaceae bacterium]